MPTGNATEEIERLSALIELMGKNDNFKDIVKDVIHLRNIVIRLEHRTEENDTTLNTVADRLTRLEARTAQDVGALKRELQEVVDRINGKITAHMEAITASIHKLELHDASQAPTLNLIDKILKTLAAALAVGALGALVKFAT